jgi:anaerobic ribonucleoside-triphosphate reductase
MSELKDEERQRCEVWSRCMGYHRPVSNWNIGKKQEFEDRTPFKEPEWKEN